MANANILRLEPNATYIPLTRVGVLRWVMGSFSVFRYQHVGIPNAKFSHWGVTGFASEWNIGLRMQDLTE